MAETVSTSGQPLRASGTESCRASRRAAARSVGAYSRRVSGGLADIGDDKATPGQGRHVREIYPQVLPRHGVEDVAGQKAHCLLHQHDRQPLARAAMPGIERTGALRDKRVGIALPTAETLWPEFLGRVPEARIVVRSIQVEQHPVPDLEGVPM